MNRRQNRHAALLPLSAALTMVATAALLAGCSTDQAAKSVQQVQEAPGVYGNAINRAKAVAGTEEQHQSAGYLNRQTGGALSGDSTGGNVNAGEGTGGK